MRLHAFLPIRKGSQRIKNKNTREFVNNKSLLEIALDKLSQVKSIEKIIVSSDDENAKILVASLKRDNVIFIERPEYLCQCSTPLSSLIAYVPTIMDCTDVLWTHCTSPCVSIKSYENAIELYKTRKEHDSLMSVTRVQDFLWNDRLSKFINFDQTKCKYPRTQDLEPLMAVNNAMFIRSLQDYTDRIGKKPLLYEMSKIESIDADDTEDFDLARKCFPN